jgi:hypothetical protein
MEDFFFLHPRKFVVGGGALVVALGLFMVRGCFEADPTTVEGTVTSGGKTVTSGTVSVIAADNKVYSASIQPNGTYTVTGVPPGPVRVAVATRQPTPPPPANPGTVAPAGKSGGQTVQSGGPVPTAGEKQTRQSYAMPNPSPRQQAAPPPGTVFVPPRYADPKTSGLSTEAGRGPFNIAAD